jgi:hypothetical protein
VSDNVTSTAAETPAQQGTLELKGQPGTTQAEEEPSTRARITSDLHTTLHLSTGESRRFPNMPQRPSRGVKRVSKSSFLTSLRTEFSNTRFPGPRL